MKKVLLTVSLAFYCFTCVTLVNSTNTNAAFPIANESTTAPATTTTPLTAQETEVAMEMAASHAATAVKAEKKKGFFSKLFSSGKSQVVALILCIVVGGLGIHRFYLGYTWQGVVQLLTAGGCGIWALIDLIRIITGDLQPKNGSYDKTL
jgi:hypothetical protein